MRLAVPAALVIAVLALSVHLGPDASWDLRNYHIYNPFALLHKPAGVDLAAAQMQSFLPPAPDLASYWLRLNAHPDVLDAILGLPTAIGAVIAYRIGLLLTPRPVLVLLAVAFGVTGAAGWRRQQPGAARRPSRSIAAGRKRDPRASGAALGVGAARVAPRATGSRLLRPAP